VLDDFLDRITLEDRPGQLLVATSIVLVILDWTLGSEFFRYLKDVFWVVTTLFFLNNFSKLSPKRIEVKSTDWSSDGAGDQFRDSYWVVYDKRYHKRGRNPSVRLFKRNDEGHLEEIMAGISVSEDGLVSVSANLQLEIVVEIRKN
jgi:hypothetical protein